MELWGTGWEGLHLCSTPGRRYAAKDLKEFMFPMLGSKRFRSWGLPFRASLLDRVWDLVVYTSSKILQTEGSHT